MRHHRFLKALVAIDLKLGSFEPEHAGKMDFYGSPPIVLECWHQPLGASPRFSEIKPWLAPSG